MEFPRVSKVANIFFIAVRISRPNTDCALVSSDLLFLLVQTMIVPRHQLSIIMTFLQVFWQALLCWYAAMLAYRALFGQTRRLKDKTLLVIFGSGGHTTEMLLMLKTLNPAKYGSVHFVLGHSDNWTLTKINDFMATQATFKLAKPLKVGEQTGNISVHQIFRAREVKQSYSSSVLTTLWAIVRAFVLVAQIRPSLIVTNGPGTAVPICWASFSLQKILLLDFSAKQIFVESFCRVQTLSLTGLLLRPIVDV